MNDQESEAVIHSHPGADRPHQHSGHEHPTGDTAVERVELREEQLQARTQQVEAGRVRLGKEVVEEQRTLEVPVTREEVTIERHAVDRRPATGQIDAAEEATIQVPVREERVEVEKTPVVYEEVAVGKQAVQEQQRVSATVRREEVVVDTEGEAHPHQERDLSR